jgi:Resolvase, N terminal domain
VYNNFGLPSRTLNGRYLSIRQYIWRRAPRFESSRRLADAHRTHQGPYTRIDRLARSIGDLQDIVRAVRSKGASLRATERPIDTITAAGKAFLEMLGVFAGFETNLRKERQAEGIAKAKAAGIYKGSRSYNMSQNMVCRVT